MCGEGAGLRIVGNGTAFAGVAAGEGTAASANNFASTTGSSAFAGTAAEMTSAHSPKIGLFITGPLVQNARSQASLTTRDKLSSRQRKRRLIVVGVPAGAG